MPGARCWMPVAGCRLLVAGCPVLGAGCWGAGATRQVPLALPVPDASCLLLSQCLLNVGALPAAPLLLPPASRVLVALPEIPPPEMPCLRDPHGHACARRPGRPRVCAGCAVRQRPWLRCGGRAPVLVGAAQAAASPTVLLGHQPAPTSASPTASHPPRQRCHLAAAPPTCSTRCTQMPWCRKWWQRCARPELELCAGMCAGLVPWV